MNDKTAVRRADIEAAVLVCSVLGLVALGLQVSDAQGLGTFAGIAFKVLGAVAICGSVVLHVDRRRR